MFRHRTSNNRVLARLAVREEAQEAMMEPDRKISTKVVVRPIVVAECGVAAADQVASLDSGAVAVAETIPISTIVAIGPT